MIRIQMLAGRAASVAIRRSLAYAVATAEAFPNSPAPACGQPIALSSLVVQLQYANSANRLSAQQMHSMLSCGTGGLGLTKQEQGEQT